MGRHVKVNPKVAYPIASTRLRGHSGKPGAGDLTDPASASRRPARWRTTELIFDVLSVGAGSVDDGAPSESDPKGTGMTTSSVALVLLGDTRDRLDIEELAPDTSDITGQPLRRIRMTARVREHDSEPLNAQLSAAATGEEPLVDSTGARWKVLNHSYSYQSGNGASLHAHVAELVEDEHLVLVRLEFEGITVTADRWSIEKKADEPIVLELLADLDPEHHARFEQILEARRGPATTDPYFPVTLSGIKDEPMPMRFGRCLWEPVNDQTVRHRIVLVSEDDGGGDSSFVGFNEPETSRLIQQSILATAKIDSLIAELKRAGTLDDDALERIEAATSEPPHTLRRNFDRAEDIDTFYTGS